MVGHQEVTPSPISTEVGPHPAAAGDPLVAAQRLDLLQAATLLASTDAALALAAALVTRKAVPGRAAEDAAHIAIATVHGMDYVLTWNCKHIANARLQKLIEAVCFDLGFELPVICTPEELMGD